MPSVPPILPPLLPPKPFGEYYAAHLASTHRHISELLQPGQAAFAATVHLFRFDKRLSSDFIQNNVDAFVRAISEISGVSVIEAHRVFLSSFHNASRVYFGTGWNNISTFVKLNSSALHNLHVQNTKITALTDAFQTISSTPEIDPVLLQGLLENGLPVLVMVSADYCSVCKAIRPYFEEAARSLEGNAIFVTVNGPRSPDFKDQHQVASYPAVLRFSKFGQVTRFPKSRRQMTVENLMSFAAGRSDFQFPASLGSPVTPPEATLDERLDQLVSRRSSRSQWQAMLRRQGIDELDALVMERNEARHSSIDLAIQCGTSSCDISAFRHVQLSEGQAPPLCVLLGGGMGAGKTSAVGQMADTDFWKAHGDGVVVVEADAFKLNDPLFQILQSVTPLASRIVHKDSIMAAEELFLRAVNLRRDVVFDGTLSWYEYARQTVDMLRDTEYLYERGPGYGESPSGEVTELYWVRAEKRAHPVEPYQVELVGVTANAEISVMRGIVRKIITGRGVAVKDQLKSHALFSQHFEQYVDIMDAVYLFDSSLTTSPESARDYASHLVAIKSGILFGNPESGLSGDGFEAEFVVRYAEAYERFLLKKLINTNATGVSELFSTFPSNEWI